MLFSRRARVNGVAFLATLLVSVFAVTAIGAFAAGLVLLVAAVRSWRNRADTSVPSAFNAIANMGPVPVIVLALGVTFFNPKNLIVLLAAGAVRPPPPASIRSGSG